jgi:mannose-6-phosphate isomerase-like protein (cupin superfamily)
VAAPTRPTHRSEPLNLRQTAAELRDTWTPRVAAAINDVLVKLVRIEGDFVWHNHPDTDEAFVCLSGRVIIDLRDGEPEQERSVTLDPGDLYVIPRGIYHCPHAEPRTTVALLEAAGTVNTGAVASDLTAPLDQPLDS